jgi:hypothetical protein
MSAVFRLDPALTAAAICANIEYGLPVWKTDWPPWHPEIHVADYHFDEYFIYFCSRILDVLCSVCAFANDMNY